MQIIDNRKSMCNPNLKIFKNCGFICWLWGPKKQYLELYLLKWFYYIPYITHVAVVFLIENNIDFINIENLHEEVIQKLDELNLPKNLRVYLT